MSLPREIANFILEGSPMFMRAVKEMVAMSTEVGSTEAVRNADRIFEPVYRSEDAIEGPLAFREKRKPNWRGC